MFPGNCPNPIDYAKLPEEEKTVLKQDGAKEVVEASVRVLSELNLESEALFETFMTNLKKSTAQKGKALFMPLRVALTGHLHGPELKGIFNVLDRKSIVERLQKALTFFK